MGSTSVKALTPAPLKQWQSLLKFLNHFTSRAAAFITPDRPRVIEQTIKQQLPDDFQRAEFLLEHGLIDMIVQRKQMRKTLGAILRHLNSARPRREGPPEQLEPSAQPTA